MSRAKKTPVAPAPATWTPPDDVLAREQRAQIQRDIVTAARTTIEREVRYWLNFGGGAVQLAEVCEGVAAMVRRENREARRNSDGGK